MEDPRGYDSFPLWIPFLSLLVAISIYALGAYILWGFGIIMVVLYIIYCLWVEIDVLRCSCVNCYYYGKICGLGRGKLCSMFFQQGEPRSFIEREITFAKLLPDFLVFVLPIIGGILLLVRDFDWQLLAMMMILLALSLGGNAVIRGSLACKYCKQRKLGCPAEQMFKK